MNINRIGSSNNFGAKAVGKLAKEIENKKKDLTSPNKIHSNITGVFVDNKEELDNAEKKINSLLPSASVDIHKNNPDMYYIHVPGFDIFAERKEDKDSYDYQSLIKALTYLKENHSFDKK